MKITEVTIHLVGEEKLKAYVTIAIDDAFLIRDLKIIQGSQSLFVAMPSKKHRDGSFKDIAHPLNKETRQQLEQVIFQAYEAALSENTTDHSPE